MTTTMTEFTGIFFQDTVDDDASVLLLEMVRFFIVSLKMVSYFVAALKQD